MGLTPIAMQYSEQPNGIQFTLEAHDLYARCGGPIPNAANDRVLIGTREQFPRLEGWMKNNPIWELHLLAAARELTGMTDEELALRGVFLTSFYGPMTDQEKRDAPKLWVWPYPSELWGPLFPWGVRR